MPTSADIKALIEKADSYHESLNQQAIAVSRFRDIAALLLRCLEFIEARLPSELTKPWYETNQVLPFFADRALQIPGEPGPDPLPGIYSITASGSSATSDAFSFITGSFNYLEDKVTREEYSSLADAYRDILAGPPQQSEVHTYFLPVNTVAVSKFDQSIKSLYALPRQDDPQGPLLEMRSAIDLALDSLLALTPLTRRERGNLKSVSVVPTIAQHLALDDIAKMDLILANDRFQKLKSQLSAAKEKRLDRDQAESLMAEAIALLHLLSRTLRPAETGEGGRLDSAQSA